MTKILVAEDDKEQADRLKTWLSRERYIVDTVHNGQEALDYLRSNEYDVVVLDWVMPGMDGLTVLTEYRNSRGTSPVLMLTGKKDLSDKEAGLDCGADDYLTKPFELRELSARIRALLRRPQTVKGLRVQIGDLVLETDKRKVSKRGVALSLHTLEFALLELLMRNPNVVFSHETLLERVWPTDSEPSVEGIRTYIKLIRQKIDEEGKESLIKTIRGIGYRLEWDVPIESESD
jgi:DNA-binding response OmpR family regulator